MLNKISDTALEQVVGGQSLTVTDPNGACAYRDPSDPNSILLAMNCDATLEGTGEYQEVNGQRYAQVFIPGGGPISYGWVSANQVMSS